MLSALGNRQTLGASKKCLVHYGQMEFWPDRLRRMRRATGLSQAKVGAHLNISGPSVAQWEIGRSKPEVGKLGR
jgi:DNA-binding transcriptional regulator YiaG